MRKSEKTIVENGLTHNLGADELKAKDQMKWVGMMNNIRTRAEEMVVRKFLLI